MPHAGDMAIQGMGLVLGEHDHLAVFGIHQIAQREIDQAVHAAEGDGRFGAIPGQRH